MKVEKIGITDQVMALASPVLKEFDAQKYPTAYVYARRGLLFPAAFAAIAAVSSTLSVLREAYGIGTAVSNVFLAAFFGIIPLAICFFCGVFKDESKLEAQREARIFDDLRESLLRHPVRSWAVKQELLAGDSRGLTRAYCLYCEDENGRRFTEIQMPVNAHHFGSLTARFTEEGWGAPREAT